MTDVAENQTPGEASQDERKFEDLSPEEQASLMHQRYYSAANSHGAILSDLLVIAGRMGQYAGIPHYRAIAGAGLTARALAELNAVDKEAAKLLFQELANGLIGLGSELGLAEASEKEDT